MEQTASQTGKRRIDLSLASKRISDLTGRPGPGHRRIWTACVDGRIPAERGDNGRWTVAEDDLPTIAAHFGLTPREDAPRIAA